MTPPSPPGESDRMSDEWRIGQEGRLVPLERSPKASQNDPSSERDISDWPLSKDCRHPSCETCEENYRALERRLAEAFESVRERCVGIAQAVATEMDTKATNEPEQSLATKYQHRAAGAAIVRDRIRSLQEDAG